MVDRGKVKTYPFTDIPRKVNIKDFASVDQPYPKILGGNSLQKIVAAIQTAKKNKKPIVWALGAYVTKCGLAPLLLDLSEYGYATHIVLNGAAAIHDVEIAKFGQTSEWVENGLRDGLFGFTQETGEMFFRAIHAAEGPDGLVNSFCAMNEFPYGDQSLIASFAGPILYFSAMGTETIYQHPLFSDDAVWEKIGKISKIEFDRLIDIVQALDDGGVYINCCSSVVLPEIFLKCFSMCANLGVAPKEGTWTAISLDKRQQYRVTENVLKRPGGMPIELLGEIELTIPAIYQQLRKNE